MNIRVVLNTNIADGSEVVFRSPADCSQVTGLVIYHNGGKTEFAFADAHGNNVGDIDHLFAENAVVKVILDVTASMAFVQNADTNAYIERTFVKTVNGQAPDENGNVEIKIPEGGGSGGNVDLTGYATESFVEGYVDGVIQNMGEVGGFATENFVESKISGLAVAKTEDMTQPVGIDANGSLWISPTSGPQGPQGPQGEKGDPGTPGNDGADGEDGRTPVMGEDYFTDSDKAEIVDAVKVAVPLVKVAEQPTPVNSVDEMTDTSKVYVMPDMSMWAYMEDYFSHTYTADDFVADALNTNGALLGNGTPNRIATASMIDLSKGTVSVYCPAPYQYIVYYYTDRAASAYIGKTTFRTGNIDDVLKDTVASGTLDGAMYCRISLRDGESTTVDLSGRVDEFLSKVAITQKGNTKEYAWKNTGFSYNQPSDYEDRIVALEQALEVLANGAF